MALTAKKKLFADAILAGKSNKDAAIAAGYSAATAIQAGSRLVNKDPDVITYIDSRKKRTPKGKAPAAPVDAELAGAAERAGFDVTKAFSTRDALEFLIAAFNDPMTEPKLRIDSAKAVVPYQHAKVGETGKKDAKGAAAEKAANKFASLATPKLVVNNRK